MSSTDPAALGSRIAAARTRAGLTQAELATALAMPRSALSKIENGGRRVSALELAEIADALGERIEWFVTEAPVSIVSHRNLQDPGVTSPLIDRVVERVARNVEFVARHDDRWASAVQPPLQRPDTVEDADRSAQAARVVLGVDKDRPLLDVAARAAHVGLLVFCFDLGPDAADAASILLADGGVAVVNGHLQVGRRRLAIAHELGHYLFADDYAIDWRIAEQDDDAAWETRLDRFARAVLLPAAALRRRWAELRSEDDLRTAAVKAGSAFRVDMSTLARRLWELDQVSSAEVRQIRAVSTTRADIIELNLVVNDEVAPPALARRYEEAVLRLYRNETVSAARATDLLLDVWDEGDLPTLPPLSESAIWKFV